MSENTHTLMSEKHHTLPTTITAAMTQHYTLAAQELSVAAVELRDLLRHTSVNDLGKNLSVGNACDASSIASALSTVLQVATSWPITTVGRKCCRAASTTTRPQGT
ncbi:hypothetical protein BH24ACT15_BH24ACT15_24610 [soil metagenome]